MRKELVLGMYACAYLLLFGTWATFVYLGTTGAEAIITYVQAALVALTSHVFTLINSASKP